MLVFSHQLSIWYLSCSKTLMLHWKQAWTSKPHVIFQEIRTSTWQTMLMAGPSWVEWAMNIMEGVILMPLMLWIALYFKTEFFWNIKYFNVHKELKNRLLKVDWISLTKYFYYLFTKFFYFLFFFMILETENWAAYYSPNPPPEITWEKETSNWPLNLFC